MIFYKIISVLTIIVLFNSAFILSESNGNTMLYSKKNDQIKNNNSVWLSIISPNGGEQCSDLLMISWKWGGSIPILPVFFNVYYKKIGENWHMLSIDCENYYYLWDIKNVSDGQYIVKVDLFTDDDLDGHGDTKWATDNSDDWFIIDNNDPPLTPYNPIPNNGETDVYINSDISWKSGDSDGDPVTYDVYFGKSSILQKVAINQSYTYYNPEIMEYNTKYYWQIVAWDDNNLSATSPMWNFTTEKKDNTPPFVKISKPKKAFYVNDNEVVSFFFPVIIGEIQIWPYAYDDESGIKNLRLYINNDLKANFSSVPKSWIWNETCFGIYTIRLIAYDNANNNANCSITVFKIF